VLDLTHFGDQIGEFDQLARSVAAGDDHVLACRPLA